MSTNLKWNIHSDLKWNTQMQIYPNRIRILNYNVLFCLKKTKDQQHTITVKLLGIGICVQITKKYICGIGICMQIDTYVHICFIHLLALR